MWLTSIATLIIWKLIAAVNTTVLLDYKAIKEIDTLAVYDYQNHGALLDYLKDKEYEVLLKIPHVFLTQEVSWNLRMYFTEHVLCLVYVEVYDNEDILKILKQSLYRWHLRYIIFVTSVHLEPINKWWSLFQWCHTNGFFNTLLMDFQQSILITYDHFQTQQVVYTTLEDFLDYSKHLTNINGFPIRVTLGNSPPRALIWHDAQQKLKISGYYTTILEVFARQHNASLDFLIISHKDFYNELDCLHYIENNKTDLCGDGMIMGLGYEVTRPEEISYSYLLVPYDEPLDRFYYFIKPFQLEVWFLDCLNLLNNIVLLSLIQRLQGGTWDLSHNALNSIMAFSNLPFELRRIKGWRRFYLQFLMFIGGFMVANWYLSVLSSLLLSRLYSHYISSLEDLVFHNISIMISDYEFVFLNTSELSALLVQQLKVVDNEVLHENRRNLNPAYAYYSQYEKNVFYL